MNKDINEQFEDTLFSEQDIEYVEEKVNENLPILYGANCSLNSEDIEDIKDKINILYNAAEKKLFRKYENAIKKDIAQQNCLAYYLGIKQGIEIGEIK